MKDDWLSDELAREPRLITVGDSVVAVDERGAFDGTPLLWCHGSPSARLEALIGARWAAEHGFRLLVPDRPGIGRSTPRLPNATVAEVAAVHVRVLDALGVERVAVCGGSGGAPYSVALAALLGDRCLGAVASAPGGLIPGHARSAGVVDRVAVALAHHVRWPLAAYFSVMRLGRWVPGSWLAAGLWLTPGREAAALRERALAPLLSPLLEAAFAQGVGGAIDDFARMGRDWGVDYRAAGRRLRLVQGTADPFVPVAAARALAELTGAPLRIIPGGGHLDAVADLTPDLAHLRGGAQ